MHAAKALAAGTAAVAAGELLPSIIQGQPPLQAIASVVDRATATASGVLAIDPRRRNMGPMATPEQIALWEAKVGRNPSLRGGITQVPRVATNPLVGGAHPQDMRVFAQTAGEASGTGIKGGYCLAVLMSVETWLGVAGHGAGACWNYNLGNAKFGRTQALAPVTRPCFFLVDNIHSLDFYPAYPSLLEGIRGWGQSTWNNSTYNAPAPGKKTCLEAMRDGDINAFCEALGRHHYAASYTASRLALSYRAKLLTRVAPYQRFAGPSALDAGVLIYT